MSRPGRRRCRAIARRRTVRRNGARRLRARDQSDIPQLSPAAVWRCAPNRSVVCRDLGFSRSIRRQIDEREPLQSSRRCAGERARRRNRNPFLHDAFQARSYFPCDSGKVRHRLMTNGPPLQPIDHETFLRHSFAVARRARTHGNHPFGAILASAAGDVLIETENGFLPECDMTAHAERLLATQASKQFDSRFLAGCTLYTSAEPCAMCAGAIYWASIGRVVFGLSERRLKTMTGDHA